MLLGTTVGVILNTVSPTWLIVVTLVIVIGYGAKRTTCRGIRQFRKERAAAEAKKKNAKRSRGEAQGDAEGLIVMDPGSSSALVVVKDLRPRTHYFFRCRQRNKTGWSPHNARLLQACTRDSLACSR